MHRKRQINVNKRIRYFEPFPQQLDAAETIDDPFVIGKQSRVRLKILFVRNSSASRSVLELVNNREWQSGDVSEFTRKR